MKNVCFFGIYDPQYSRNRVLIDGFKKNGYEVLECRVDPKKTTGIKKYVEIIKKWKKLCSELDKQNRKLDMLLVAYPGQTIVFLAKLLSRRHLVVFDAFVSLHDSNLNDRKKYNKWSVRSLRDYLLDWGSARLADKVLLDTNEHLVFFERHFGIDRNKMIRVPVGTDVSIFKPNSLVSNKAGFTVHFHGHYIPLQGVEYIIGAAELLNDKQIKFRLIGKGQQFEEMRNLAGSKRISNIEFIGEVTLEKLPEFIGTADVCLGIFGRTEKAKRVVPNKVYEYLAMAKPVITMDSPAIREFFEPDKEIIVCHNGDSKSLAEKIVLVKNQPELAKQVAMAGYEKFKQIGDPANIVADLLHSLQK